MNFLGEAFKRLNTLQEDTFDITDTDIAELEDAVVGTDEDETIDIIDDEVETFEELQPSYVGKVILDCNVCHSLVYKDKADVVLSDDGEDANLSDECPYCMSTDGFKIVGEVAPFAEEAEEEIEVKVDDEPVEAEEADSEEEVEIEESLTEAAEICPGCGKDKEHCECEKELEECGNPINEGAARIPLAKYDPRFGDEYTIDSSGNVYENGELRKWRPGQSQWAGKLDAVTKKGMKTTIAQQKLRDFVVDNPRLFEGFEDVSITTEDQHMEMSADENGKITVTTEPVENEAEDETEDEMIVPVDDELEAEIEAGPEEEALVDGEEFEDEFVADEDGDVEVDLEDIDEESLDDVTESYLREVYENVDSFKTTGITQKGNTLKVEGVINFKSGKERKTSFLFEAKHITKKGKVKLIGMNESITRGKKPYTITGTVTNKKLVVESFNYNYRQKDENGNSIRLYNTCKRSK